MSSADIARKAQHLQQSAARLVGAYEERVQFRDAYAANRQQLAVQVETLALTNAALDSLLATASADSLRAIEQTVTYGLQTVFDDRGLTFSFRVAQVRGVQSAEPVLTSPSGVVSEDSILEAFGGGPGTLVAFLLRLIVCHRLGLYPLILLDETFRMVSREYLPNLYRLLKELADKLGYTFVLVTHEREAMEHADRVYGVVVTPDGTTFEELP